MAGENTEVSLKEFLLTKICGLEKLQTERELRADERFRATEKLTEDRTQATKEALLLQAAETERRLLILNGEAGRITAVLSQSVTRELHDAQMKEINAKIDDLMLSRKESEGKTQGVSSVTVIIVVIIGFAISITGLVISLVK